MKDKWLLMFIFILLIGFLATSFFSYKIAANLTTDRLKYESLPSSLDNVSSEVKRLLLRPHLISSLMANDTFLKYWILNGEEDVKKIQNYLVTIKKQYDTSSTFFVSGRTMNYYYSQGILKKISPTQTRDIWFYRLKDMNNDYESNIDFDLAQNDSLTIFINYKVKDFSGNFIGATGVGIKLSQMNVLLERYKNKYHHNVYFMNNVASIVLSSKSLELDKYINRVDFFKRTIDKCSKSCNSVIDYEYKNDKYVLNVRYIKELDLYLFVEAKERHFTQELDDSFKFNVVIFIVVTLIVIIIIIGNVYYHQKVLERLSFEDKLTALPNRSHFDLNFDRIFNSSRLHEQDVTVILFDIDNFKHINDTFGHLIGDEILVLVANLLKKCFRDNDIIARWGGEEFIVLLTNVDEKKAFALAEKLRFVVATDMNVIKIIKKPLTISLGVATKNDNELKEDFFTRVDEHLYQAKRQGKNRTVASRNMKK
jgi:diguanylate cyclase (GGDEF)-like protein